MKALGSTHLCSRHSFDDVTRINFRFRLLVIFHLRMAMTCIYPPSLVQIRLSNSELLTFSVIQHGARCHLVFSSYANLAFRHVSSVVLELCTKFGSNIGYSHWDRRIYAPDVHLMTSRELTSGYDCWSRGHLRTSVSHHPTKFDADIFIQSGVVDIFQKFKMAAAAISDFHVMWIWHIPSSK